VDKRIGKRSPSKKWRDMLRSVAEFLIVERIVVAFRRNTLGSSNIGDSVLDRRVPSCYGGIVHYAMKGDVGMARVVQSSWPGNTPGLGMGHILNIAFKLAIVGRELEPGDPMILQCFMVIVWLVRDECISGKVIANGLVRISVGHLMVC